MAADGLPDLPALLDVGARVEHRAARDTTFGIGGITRWISVPTHSRTLKETSSRPTRKIHSLRFAFMTHLLLR